MRIGYFAHDLEDPAVHRRVRMLRAGGADVLVFGFRRSPAPVELVAGAPAVDLGRTRDGRLASRVGSVLRAALTAPVWSRRLGGVDAVMARNLEMLAIARAAVALAAPRAKLTYEVLDIHRMMLGDRLASRGLRWLERILMWRTSRLVVSSPAFISNYFDRFRQPAPDTLLQENKVLNLEAVVRGHAARPGPPWRIGWFGVIRCRRSLEILADLATRSAGLIEVEIRGRPALTEFEDFNGSLAKAPGLIFLGPYDAADVPDLYARVHFAWAIDYFEEGLNSAWLLPNRLYESQVNGVVPIALRTVETGRWLARHAAGLLVDDPARELGPALSGLSESVYLEMVGATAAVPTEELVTDQADCERLARSVLTLGTG